MLARFPVTQGDMDFGRRPERTNGVFAFVQGAHAFDLPGYGLLQRSANRAGLAAHRASRTTQSARFRAFSLTGCNSFCQVR
jgi:hypothetical protein